MGKASPNSGVGCHKDEAQRRGAAASWGSPPLRPARPASGARGTKQSGRRLLCAPLPCLPPEKKKGVTGKEELVSGCPVGTSFFSSAEQERRSTKEPTFFFAFQALSDPRHHPFHPAAIPQKSPAAAGMRPHIPSRHLSTHSCSCSRVCSSESVPLLILVGGDSPTPVVPEPLSFPPRVPPRLTVSVSGHRVSPLGTSPTHPLLGSPA